METVAVNRVTVTRELFAESHAAVFSHRRRKMLLYCGIVFLAFGLALLAVQTRFPVASALCVPALLSGVIVTDRPLPRTATGKIKRWELQNEMETL